MKVALLGAGHIGQRIARLLHGSGDYQVTVFDQNARALAELAAEGIGTHVVGDALESIGPALSGQQIIVNALPYHLAIAAARMSLVKIADASPCGTSLCSRSASSKSP